MKDQVKSQTDTVEFITFLLVQFADTLLQRHTPPPEKKFKKMKNKNLHSRKQIKTSKYHKK